MSASYDRPGSFARWGWIGAAVNALFVLANLACIVIWDGGLYNWLAIAVCTVSGGFAFRIWRDGVRSDAKHRAWMRRHDAAMAALARQIRGL